MIELGQMTEITIEKYGDTYEIRRRFNYLEMYINNHYQGGIRIDRPNIYDWVIENIQSWLDNKEANQKYWEQINIDDYF